jgi:hypothetical protein
MTGALESRPKAELGLRNPQSASLQGHEGSLDSGTSILRRSGCLAGHRPARRLSTSTLPTKNQKLRNLCQKSGILQPNQLQYVQHLDLLSL